MRKLEAKNRNRRHSKALVVGRRRGKVKIAAHRAKTLNQGGSEP